MPRDLRSLTAAWYAQEFLRELVLIYPVYAIMMDGTPGITPFDLSLLFFVWSATVLALELPSGTLADRWPRRRVLLAAGLLKASCFLVWWLEPSFGGFLAGFVLWGVAGSLRSGCAESLLHDHLAAHGREGEFARVYGRGEAAGATAVALAMVLGGWLAQGGYEPILLLSAVAPLAAAILVLVFVPEPPRSTTGRSEEPYLETMRAGLAEARRSPRLRRALLYLCTVVLVYDVLEEFFGPLFHDDGLSLGEVGVALALTHAARAAGFLAAARFGGGTGSFAAVLFALSAALLGAAAGSGGWAVVALLLGFVGLSAWGRILVQSRFQLAIEGHARATTTSVAALGRELTALALYLVVGAVATGGSWSTAFGWTAAALGAAAIALGLGEPRARHGPGGPADPESRGREDPHA